MSKPLPLDETAYDKAWAAYERAAGASPLTSGFQAALRAYIRAMPKPSAPATPGT